MKRPKTPAGGGKGGGKGAAPGKAAPHKAPPAWHPVSVAQQRKQHQAAVKAARTRAKHPKPAKKAAAKKPVRQLALGEGVACCSVEALAASLRLTGHPVSDADVLALYRRTADGPDAGASIEDTLEAAARFGLAGVRPTRWLTPSPAPPLLGRTPLILGLDLPEGPHAVCDDGTCWWSWGQRWSPAAWPGAVTAEAWAVTW